MTGLPSDVGGHLDVKSAYRKSAFQKTMQLRNAGLLPICREAFRNGEKHHGTRKSGSQKLLTDRKETSGERFGFAVLSAFYTTASQGHHNVWFCRHKPRKMRQQGKAS